MVHEFQIFMAFYVKPPKGNIPLDKLFNFGEKRLRFLYELCSTSENKLQDLIQRVELLEKADCLIEGTTKDKVSHFLLKIICTETEMQEFFIQSETVLFSLRLQFHNLRNIRKILRIASCEILDILSKHKFICVSYKKILLSLVSMKEQLETLAKDRSVSQEIKVPFIHALNFVEARLAPVHHGYVVINVEQLKPLLTGLFEQSLIESFTQLKSSACRDYIEDDWRIRDVEHRLQVIFTKLNKKPRNLVCSSRKIRHSELDHASKYFPLCMKHLHNVLRQRHRLKHKSRIQYILFLKEIGVPWEEAIKLFEQEYSKAPGNCEQHSTCMHSWSKDRNRYIYSIRHLYGKEGSCNNYRGHSCQNLQSSNMTASEEGGCPFAHFDMKHLQGLLTEVCDVEDLVTLSTENKYRSACTSYLMTQLKQQASQATILDNTEDNVQKIASSSLQSPPFFSSANCLGNDVALKETNSPVMSCSNEFFVTLSDLIFHPSDFYKICSNPVWQKFF